MKRWIILLGAVLMLLLAGCSSRQQVGICLRDLDDPVTQRCRESLVQTLTQAGYAVTVRDGGNDQSRQDRQVGELLEKKTDILILEPVMTTALEDILGQARQANVPVVLINREPEDSLLEGWDRLCYVGCDMSRAGQLQAQLPGGLANGGDYNGDGILSYGIIAGPEDHLDTKQRTESCIQALEAGDLQTRQLALAYGQWTREDARKRCSAMLARLGKDLEVIFCNSDELAQGAMDAILEGGRAVGENIWLYGIDGQRESLLLIRSGDLSGTVSLDFSAKAEAVLAAVQKLLRGGTPEKVSYVNPISVDAMNVEEIIKNAQFN